MATALKVRARLRFSELMEALDKEYDDYIHALMEQKRQIRKKMLDQFLSHVDTITMSATDDGGLSQPSFGLNDDIPFEIDMDDISNHESLDPDIEVDDQEPTNGENVDTADDANARLVDENPLVVEIDGKKRYKCQFCSYTTPHKTHCKTHEMRHRGEKPHSCRYCDYRSVAKSTVTKHGRRRHSNCASSADDKDYEEGTDGSYASGNVSDESEEEPGKPSLKCQYCKYVAPHQSYLNIHEMRHTGEKPHKCELCSYRAVTKREIFLHTKRNHMSAAKQISKRRSPRNLSKAMAKTFHKCRYCAYKTPRKDILAVHEMRHTGQKPHKCSYCEYRAVTRKEVADHEKTHSRDRKYPCRFCAYRAKTKRALKNHETLQHKDKSRKT